MLIQLWIVKQSKVLTTKSFSWYRAYKTLTVVKIYTGVFWIIIPCSLVSELQMFWNNKVPQSYRQKVLTWTSRKHAPPKHLYHLHDYMVSYPLRPQKQLFCPLPCFTENAIAICHITHIHKIHIFIVSFSAKGLVHFLLHRAWQWQDALPSWLSNKQHLCLYSSTLVPFFQFQGLLPKVLLACHFYRNKQCYSFKF